MANFQNHLTGGILISGAAVLGLHGAGWISPQATIGYFALGVVGSLLPDIDAAASRPVRAFFAVGAVALAFLVTLPLIGRLPALELVLAWAGVYLGVRYGVVVIFSRLTIHRGIWHSWLGVAVATLATVDIAHWLYGASAQVAWIAGLMVGIGYLTHLCLDEISSVDLLNSRVKRSFGTALKPLRLDDPRASLGMFLTALILFWLSPNHPWMATSTQAIEATVATVESRLMPLLEPLETWSAPLKSHLIHTLEGAGIHLVGPAARD
jgi:hypothetical protein